MPEKKQEPDDQAASPNPSREQPGTYFVPDKSSLEEMTRLEIQDQILTAGMGGVLPEQAAPTLFERVLDIGCGTGGWLIEVAKTYPSISLLVGVDISNKMIDYARTRAEEQGVSDRVQFRALDALQMLEFPADFFDLVNQRLGASFVHTWEWDKLLNEYLRLTKPGGVIRLTDADIHESSSPSQRRLNQLILAAVYQAGNFFIQKSDGITSHLAHLLQQHGVQEVQTQRYHLEFVGGTPSGQLYYEDMKYLFQTVVPFLRKWTLVPDDYETIYQQMLVEMQQPNFVARWNLLTAWGTKRQ